MGSGVPPVGPVEVDRNDPAPAPAVRELVPLTPRQVQVLRLVARGMTNVQIAEELFLSQRTVHAHLRDIFRKLRISNRSAATRWAMEHGLV